MARLLGTRNAAPIPWKERAMISCEMVEKVRSQWRPLRITPSRTKKSSDGQRISHRAADQKQRRKKQTVGLDDPLNVHHRGVKAGLQGGQSTLTTVPSMKAMLEPRMVAASTQA